MIGPGGMRTLIHASFYTFGGAAWTFLALHIQEHFFWPEDLTPHQQRNRFAMFYSRSHDALIRVYDQAGNVIETHEQAGEFREL
jgi:hypothetical protein